MAKKEKILIVSDTHGYASLLEHVMEIEKYVDRVIHLGDRCGEDDIIEKITQAPMESVRGNCDYDFTWPGETMTQIGDHLAFCCHGHMYDVDYGTEELEEAAREMGADLVFFGHIHKPYYRETEDGMIIVNPGSLARPRQRGRDHTYVILERDEDTDELTFMLKSI